ncbi:DUF4282 domain-containing protein [Streptomyces sp. NPDC006372]|uniref:DUF4282 domain-containing protein n=1 Tax=Streptomyces sp. NPDC006372 TaxID=3155599 RepID=UPI0033B4D2E5
MRIMSDRTHCPSCGTLRTSTDQACPECGHRPRSGMPPGPPPRFGPAPQHPDLPSTPTKGFFAGLFDYGFTTFVTPRVIKSVYVVATIIIAITWLFYVILGFSISAGGGLLLLIIGPIVALLWLLLCRIALELTMVLFRIGADVHTIREQNDFGNRRSLSSEAVSARSPSQAEVSPDDR